MNDTAYYLFWWINSLQNDWFTPSLNDLAVDGTLNTTNQPTGLLMKHAPIPY